MIGSDKRLDRCGVCGGNGSSCHVISGIFTRTRLPAGYNRVTLVPRGACNINVTEMVVSPNYLAIRLADGPYIVNGDRDSIGVSGEFVGAGTVFSYRRAMPPAGQEGDLVDQPAVETILAPGPLNSSIDIMVVQEHENRGIMYTYTIPTTPASDAAASHHQRTRHHHHGVRHHQQHSGNQGAQQHDAATAAPTADGSIDAAIDPAERPVNDAWVEPGADYGVQSDLAVDDHGRQRQNADDKQLQRTRSARGSNQGEASSRYQQQQHQQSKQRRHQRQSSTVPPGDHFDVKGKGRSSVANDDPQVKSGAGRGGGGGGAEGFDSVGGDAKPAAGKVQPGVNFGFPVQPRYVPTGQLYGAHQPQTFPAAAGWPYTGQQVSDVNSKQRQRGIFIGCQLQDVRLVQLTNNQKN